MRGDPREPFSIEWNGGACSAGYLGRDNWLCRLSTGVVSNAATVAEATTLLLTDALAGIPAGEEVRQRAPLSVRLGSVQEFKLVGDTRMINGWTFASARSQGDLGDHSQLAPWIEAIVCRNADRLWALGEEQSDPAPLADEFAFGSFQADVDPTERCKRLEAILSARLAEHPSPEAVLEKAATELRALGHDLWSWEPDRVWGRDYVTKRDGSDMTLTLYRTDDDDEDDRATPRITVESRLPE